MTLHFPLRVLTPYISWPYFFHAWQISARFSKVAEVHDCMSCRQSWINSFEREAERAQAKVALDLYSDALKTIGELDAEGYQAYAQYQIFPAYSDGDDILVNGKRLPFLRQQTARDGAPYLCLADFIRPLGSKLPATLSNGKPSVEGNLGIFASTVDGEMESLHKDDPYKGMLVQTVCDRLAEACTEKMHHFIRTEDWSYAPNEDLSMHDILLEKFQGIRPAVGYPSLPDQSIIFLLDELINMAEIGINLTESGAMQPHASVCGLIFAHPAARYFNIGKITEEQFTDYAKRRGLPLETMRKFLARVTDN